MDFTIHLICLHGTHLQTAKVLLAQAPPWQEPKAGLQGQGYQGCAGWAQAHPTPDLGGNEGKEREEKKNCLEFLVQIIWF